MQRERREEGESVCKKKERKKVIEREKRDRERETNRKRRKKQERRARLEPNSCVCMLGNGARGRKTAREQSGTVKCSSVMGRSVGEDQTGRL